MLNSINRFAILAFSALALALAGCSETAPTAVAEKTATKDEKHEGDEHGNEALIKLSPDEIQRAGIRTEALEEKEIRDELTVTATVQPNQDAIVRIAPRISGRIMQAPARLGDIVKAGQLLATLDSLEMGEAHSAYLQAMSEFRLAAAAFERAERLHAEQVIPSKDYQRARAEHEKARTQLASAENRLRLLGAPANSLSGKSAVSTFPLTAPRSGTVIEKQARLGELAKPDEPLFTVADLSSLWIEADIAEKDLVRVRKGAQANTTVAAYPDEIFPGKVTYVGAVMDKETRTIRARIEVPNAKGLLKPDMFATAIISSGAPRKALMLPGSAVTLIQGIPVVFVEEGEGFEARPIEIAERLTNRVVVKSGLKSGELVVVEGVYALKARQLKSQIGEGHAH